MGVGGDHRRGGSPVRHQLRAADSYSSQMSWRVHSVIVGVPVVPVEVPSRTHSRVGR